MQHKWLKHTYLYNIFIYWFSVMIYKLPRLEVKNLNISLIEYVNFFAHRGGILKYKIIIPKEY